MNPNFLIVDALLRDEKSTDLLNQHHLQALFFHYLNVPNEVFQNQYKKQWIHNNILLDELQHLSKEMRPFKISGTILKGAHLLGALYTDLGSRFLSDVDLLIEDKDYSNWKEILAASGYSSIETSTFFGNDFKSQWFKLIGEVEINLELHAKLFFHLKTENWNYEKSGVVAFEQLSLEDTFVHLCGHLAFQHTFLKLYWLFDIYFYVSKFGSQMNWEKIIIKSKACNLFQSVTMCLWCLHKYFELDNSLVQMFKLNKARWWHKYLSLDFLLRPDGNKSRYFLIKHATKDHLSESLWYDITWFWHYKIQKKLLK